MRSKLRIADKKRACGRAAKRSELREDRFAWLDKSAQRTPQRPRMEVASTSNAPIAPPPPGTGSSSPEARTRLLVRDPALNEEAHAVRMNVLNSSVAEARDARNTRLIMWVITLVNVPQIVAASVIMGLKWKDETLCYRIQIWVLIHTIHLALTLSLEWVLYFLNGDGSNRTIRWREQYMAYISQLKYGLDLVGLFWFLVGNMWVISDGARCDDGSTMYHLALWMIIISYAKIFLPCLLLLALLPVICFCLPCVIRLLSRLQDPMRGKGATKDVINQLTTQKFQPSQFAPEDSSCCICLNDYELHQDLRVLPCSHHFHKDCVDEWLMVNSTCPTCRTSIFDGAISNSTNNGGDAPHGTEQDVMRNV